MTLVSTLAWLGGWAVKSARVFEPTPGRNRDTDPVPSGTMECEMAGCEKEATFELHIPWTENERVCAGHARVRSRQDGIVADPLESAGDELPGGAADSGNR